jgi:hypothetical protein
MNDGTGGRAAKIEKDGAKADRLPDRPDLQPVDEPGSTRAKGNPRYRKGVRLERRIIGLLREAGCLHAYRSAGSHGAWDVCAPFPEFTVLIQCKAYKPTASDIAKVENASKDTEARWAVCWTEGGKVNHLCYRKGIRYRVLVPGLSSGSQ